MYVLQAIFLQCADFQPLSSQQPEKCDVGASASESKNNN